MIVLGIDTALGACSAAMVRDGTTLAYRLEPMERGHAERLFPMLKEISEEAGSPLRDIDRIAVTIGPGSFTGTRVGLAAARGIALAATCPVVGISTLEAVAAAAREEIGAQDIAVFFDARRGDLYGQLFAAGGNPLTSPFAAPPDSLMSRIAAVMDAQRPLTVIGTGADLAIAALAEWPGGVGKAHADPLPDARTVAKLGAHIDPARQPPAPLYLRPPDAVPAASIPVKP